MTKRECGDKGIREKCGRIEPNSRHKEHILAEVDIKRKFFLYLFILYYIVIKNLFLRI